MFEAISIVLGGLGLIQNAGSGKYQEQIADTLGEIKKILEKQEKSNSNESSIGFVPESLWLTWKHVVQKHTVVLVTGCHEFSEAFDRPVAYSLKLAIDQFGESVGMQPLNSLVISDYWVNREHKFSKWENIIAIGGPAINTTCASIIQQGTLLTSAEKFWIYRSGSRFAVYGHDPIDTLYAMRAFAEQFLMKYLKSVWVSE